MVRWLLSMGYDKDAITEDMGDVRDVEWEDFAELKGLKETPAEVARARGHLETATAIDEYTSRRHKQYLIVIHILVNF